MDGCGDRYGIKRAGGRSLSLDRLMVLMVDRGSPLKGVTAFVMRSRIYTLMNPQKGHRLKRLLSKGIHLT
ncbi:unnamed protein product [Arabidopsis halleri]